MAKGHIFSKYAKLEAAERELRKEVKNFNKRVQNAVESGKLSKDVAPEKASYQNIMRYSIDAGATAEERAKAIKEVSKALAETAKPRGLSLVDLDGVKVTKYDWKRYQKSAAKAETERQKAQEELDRIQKHGAQVGGQAVQETEYLKEKARYPVPKPGSTFLKTAADFQKWARRFEREFSPNEWNAYRENLIKNIRKHESSQAAKKLTAFANFLTPEQIQTLYENKSQVRFIRQDDYYISPAGADEMIKEAAKFLGIQYGDSE